MAVLKISEFAEKIGVKPPNIYTYAQRGKLNIKDGYIDESDSLNKRFLDIRFSSLAINKPPKKQPKKSIEVKVNKLTELREKKAEEELKTAQIKREQLEANAKKELENMDNLVSKSEAEMIKENYIAKIKELEYKEKSGELVNRNIVYLQLYEFGKELKTELQSIPSKIVADIMAADKDLNKISIIISTSINEALTKLSNIESIEFNETK